MKFFKNLFLCLLCMTGLVSCSQNKMNGASIVSPPGVVDENCFADLKEIHANWVSIIPYAFTPKNQPVVRFNGERQWWGEKSDGIKKLIQSAKKQGLKVMLKPHVWYGRAWIGDFTLTNKNEWSQWENQYTDYIVHYAKIAQAEQVALFCIGTELKKVVMERPEFFKSLIKKVKEHYQGKLTYAANWNSVNEVGCWQELDYIGVDAYYPLSDKKQPTVNELNLAWNPIKKELKKKSKEYSKPILFTEYGFESCDFNTKTTWGSNGKYDENQQAQSNAYKAYFESFYSEKWFAGGFFWKWHLTPRTMRDKKKAFTPQNKSTINVLKNNFIE